MEASRKRSLPSVTSSDNQVVAHSLDPSFYKKFENFLNRKAPDCVSFEKRTHLPSLERLKSERTKLKLAERAGPTERVGRTSALRRSARVDAAGEKEFDYELLAEAMEYASKACGNEKLNLMRGERTESKRKPAGRRRRRKKKAAHNRASKLAKQYKTKNARKKAPLRNKMSFTSGEATSQRKLTVDKVEELVRNFESGITLQKLRRDLEDSKRARDESANFILSAKKELMGS